MVASVVGVVWVGDPSTTGPQAEDFRDSLFGSSIDDDTLYLQATVFNWPFACITAPLAATIGAWEVSLLLQVFADRFDSGEGKYSSVAKYLVVIEVLGMVDLVGALFTGYPTGGIWCIIVVDIYLWLFPVALVAVGVTTLVIPCCRKVTSRGVSKAMVGGGIGIMISFAVYLCNIFAFWREYVGGTMSREDVVATVCLAIFALVMWKYLLAAVKVSLEESGEFKMLGWGLKRAMCATSSTTDAESTGLTVVGILLFVVSVNTRVCFVWVISHAIVNGKVKL